MYLASGSNYYIIPFVKRIVYTESGIAIQNPNFKVRLLTYSELSKVLMLLEAETDNFKIQEEIFTACCSGVLEFENEVILLDECAGIVDEVASKIYEESLATVNNPPQYFNSSLDTCTSIEVWAGNVANILNMNYMYVLALPVNEVIRLYAIAYLVSGRNIPPIEIHEEKVSKVGE